MRELKIKEFKSGDRYFLATPKPYVIVLDRHMNDMYWSCYAPDLGNLLYLSEIENGEIDGYPLVKVENDLHLLQLQLKYS